MSRILAVKHKPTQLDDFAHEQTIIWRQSFAGQVIVSRPIKRKKNSLRMVIDFHVGLDTFLFIIAVLSNSLVLVALQRSWRFALFVRRQKLLFRSLAVLDLLVGFILLPLHVIGLILDYKLSEYGHGVDDISFIFSFVLCGMYIFISTVTEVTIGFVLYFNLVCNFTANSHNYTCFLYRWYCSRLDLCFRWQAFLLDYSLTDNNIFCCSVDRFLYINLPQTATTSRTK